MKQQNFVYHFVCVRRGIDRSSSFYHSVS